MRAEKTRCMGSEVCKGSRGCHSYSQAASQRRFPHPGGAVRERVDCIQWSNLLNATKAYALQFKGASDDSSDEDLRVATEAADRLIQKIGGALNVAKVKSQRYYLICT